MEADALSRLTSRQLAAELRARGISTAGLLEKSDFLAALRAAPPLPPPKAPAPPPPLPGADPPAFSFHAVAPFPSLAVSPALTHSSALFGGGLPTVLHLFNAG